MALTHSRSGEVAHLQAPSGNTLPERTAALVKTDRFETVRLAVAAATTIPKHQVAGFITLYCLHGHVVIEAGDDITLRTGDWTYLDRAVPHSVRGIDDSALLLTIMFD